MRHETKRPLLGGISLLLIRDARLTGTTRFRQCESMTTLHPAPRNRTVALEDDEIRSSTSRLMRLESPQDVSSILGRTICQDVLLTLPHLPNSFVDLLIADPPYNLDKSFNGQTFKARSPDEYESWLESWLVPLRRILKPTASVYICGD